MIFEFQYCSVKKKVLHYRSIRDIIMEGCDPAVSLGETLKNKRQSLDLSLKQVCVQTGITDSRLSRIENDAAECPPSDLKKLAHLYGMSTVQLFLDAGYLDPEDLADYRRCFSGVSELDSEERDHIQAEIDFLLKRKGEQGNGI